MDAAFDEACINLLGTITMRFGVACNTVAFGMPASPAQATADFSSARIRAIKAAVLSARSLILLMRSTSCFSLTLQTRDPPAACEEQSAALGRESLKYDEGRPTVTK